MTALPFTPGTPGETILATYLRSDPRRLPVVQSIMDRLDDDGAVGDRARYYVVRSTFRRAVLRGALIALGFKLPSWSVETPAAAAANRDFVASYRDSYNHHRRTVRARG
jgi:hypothetical protein